MANKQPAFMYYPKDWRSDPVWGCSLAARGLWHEMMDRMHESEQYGYLCEQGKPIPHQRIARLCGTTLEEFNALLAELDVVGIPRRTASGVIYCKRMVEDEKKRREWRNRQNKKRILDRDVTRHVTQMSRGSSSSSSSSSSFPSSIQDLNSKPTTPQKARDDLPVWLPEPTWRAFTEMRQRMRAPLTPHAILLIFKKLTALMEHGHSPQDVLEQSIVNGWKGVFEVHGGENGSKPRGRETGALHREPAKKYKQPTILVAS